MSLLIDKVKYFFNNCIRILITQQRQAMPIQDIFKKFKLGNINDESLIKLKRDEALVELADMATEEGDRSQKHVIIVGGGLVGALNACFFAKRGWKVDIYEFRPDIRQMEHVAGRSINLALSTRGRSALDAVGLEDVIMKQGVPLHARLVHDPNGALHSLPYGKPGQFITSINRRLLNEVMLTEAEKSPNVTVHFEQKLLKCSTTKNELVFQSCKTGGETTVISTKDVDLICGCDGAYSALRRTLINSKMFNFSQSYIEHGYIELNITPAERNQFKMEANVFHLWPRGEFTMIALANTDGTFTVTLFAPWSLLDTLRADTESERQHLLCFFHQYFPDATKLLTDEHIIEVFQSVKASPLVSVKCSPHHFGDKLILLGDAAHAMVPFYGQGMNCGFEDCLVLQEILDAKSGQVGEALREYSNIRCRDAQACNDLAMYNYVELRDLVNSPLFKMRKKLDALLNYLLPHTWIPLYTMVTFSRIPYHQAIIRKAKQDKIVRHTTTGSLFLFSTAGMLAFLLSTAQGHSPIIRSLHNIFDFIAQSVHKLLF